MTTRKIPAPTAPFYWAYGSNLNVGQMMIRCPRAQKIGPLYLRDGVLVFRGVADVAARKGGVVPGGLWRITADCEAALDRYEGVGAGLYDKRYFVVEVDGQVGECLFYKMRSKGVYPPFDSYFGCIVEGYEDFGLDQQLLEAALEHSHNRKRKTQDIRDRYRRYRGRPSLAKALPEEDEPEDWGEWENEATRLDAEYAERQTKKRKQRILPALRRVS